LDLSEIMLSFADFRPYPISHPGKIDQPTDDTNLVLPRRTDP
jgi:hypothetical protein